MKVMSKITLRQMRLNKRRTIVTIIGVIISVAMFTAVATLSGSFLNFMQRAAITSNGNYHAQFIGVSSDDLETLKQDENTKSLYAIHEEGLAQLPDQFGSKRFLNVESVSVDGMEAACVNVTEGRLPQNDQEIVISQSLKNKDGDYYKIGDTVTLALGERRVVHPDEEIYGESGVLGNDMSYMGADEETFRETGKKTYTVVGFASVLPHEPTWAPYYTAITGLNPDVLYHKTLTAYVQVNHVDSTIYDWINNMAEKTGAEEATPHTGLLMYSGVDSNDDFLRSMYVLVGILFIIIFVGSVALIYNAFAISVSERSVNFGLLASVGATKRQKMRSVLFEAFLILIVAVPLGIVGGLLGIWGVFEAVNPAIRSLFNAEFGASAIGLQVTVSLGAILIAVGLSVLTTFISAWIPAKRASRISPMEAIRQTKDIKLTPRAVKTSWITRKLFGFEGELAAKNMKRNKKRYRVAIASFVISLVLFLSASSFTHFLTASSQMAVDEMEYDIAVNVYEGSTSDTDLEERREKVEKAIEEMRQLEGVTGFSSMYTWLQQTKPGDEHYTKEFLEFTQANVGQSAEDGSTYLNVLAVDDTTLREYCARVGADYDVMQDTEHPSAILINDMVWQNGRDYTNYSAYDLQKGDMLEYSYYDYTAETNKMSSFRLEAVTGETVTGVGSRRYEGTTHVNVIISEKVYKEHCLKLDHREEYYQQAAADGVDNSIETPTLYITASDPSAVTDAIDEMNYVPDYQPVHFSPFNLTSEKYMIEQMLFLINTFSYVFIALISAIGVANIFNTISTSIILRKREFAMLKSVGMSPRSFNKMLFFESLLYGLKSLLWGLPISFAMMGLIYWALEENFHMAFTVPWVHVFIGIAAIFAIVMITVLYAARKIKKENVIESLRNTNL